MENSLQTVFNYLACWLTLNLEDYRHGNSLFLQDEVRVLSRHLTSKWVAERRASLVVAAATEGGAQIRRVSWKHREHAHALTRLHQHCVESGCHTPSHPSPSTHPITLSWQPIEQNVDVSTNGGWCGPPSLKVRVNKTLCVCVFLYLLHSE